MDSRFQGAGAGRTAMDMLIVQIAGGVGLLLLGMKLMTDGLKLAGGHVLRRVLRTWTRNGLRGIMSGFFITSLVQSSGAVTVAAIGFVNAGIMTLRQAVWVVYGSNIGTTTTAWIVALLGFEVNIKAFALPLVALGVGLWLSGGVSRKSAVGEALAGFGVFFLGVEMPSKPCSRWLGSGLLLPGHDAFQGLPGPDALFAGIGFGLTFIMQSSSAAMALILTAATGGLPLDTAAAAVIGANLGSTSTAAIAVIGATSNAKRLAAVHVAFNLLTGAWWPFGLLRYAAAGHRQGARGPGHGLGPGLGIGAFSYLVQHPGRAAHVAAHARMLTRWVERRFRTRGRGRGHAALSGQHRGAHAVPGRERAAPGSRAACAPIARRMALNALECRSSSCRTMGVDKAILERLRAAIVEFAAQVSREGLSREVAGATCPARLQRGAVRGRHGGDHGPGRGRAS